MRKWYVKSFTLVWHYQSNTVILRFLYYFKHPFIFFLFHTIRVNEVLIWKDKENAPLPLAYLCSYSSRCQTGFTTKYKENLRLQRRILIQRGRSAHLAGDNLSTNIIRIIDTKSSIFHCNAHPLLFMDEHLLHATANIRIFFLSQYKK